MDDAHLVSFIVPDLYLVLRFKHNKNVITYNYIVLSVVFHCKGSLCLCGDVLGGESVCLKQRGNLARTAENVLHADTYDRYGACGANCLRNCRAESADNVMLLDRYDSARLGGGCENVGGIKGLNGVNVGNAGAYALGGEKLCRLKTAKDNDVAALFYNDRALNWSGRASEPFGMLIRLYNSEPCVSSLAGALQYWFNTVVQ